jgi:hypothetical protein
MIRDGGHLSRMISDAQIGSTSTLGVIREGRPVELKIEIERLSGSPQ